MSWGHLALLLAVMTAQLIAQSIGQAFSVAYQEFLRANGINPEDLSQKEYSDIINTQEMYNDDLIHFSNSENCKELQVEKLKGEILGVVIVESGWGSILPTVILANMMNGGPAARSGKLSIGDQIMSINGTSLVGLPLATCQGIIKVYITHQVHTSEPALCCHYSKQSMSRCGGMIAWCNKGVHDIVYDVRKVTNGFYIAHTS
ncbi:unnamed protein product [Ranitomeya imitator]|uniref:Uncharacterized protein n=1 Tax=Ranitomeya imitator TaxID=111125 RepID=A0ABN9LNU3_9NEOB|nr:unnamed protein product [Ranitomeya imitator]